MRKERGAGSEKPTALAAGEIDVVFVSLGHFHIAFVPFASGDANLLHPHKAGAGGAKAAPSRAKPGA